MYGFNPQANVDRINQQIRELEDLRNGYQQMPQQQPINNIINQQPSQNAINNMVEWRILNENEEVDNLYVKNKTLFINENTMVLKGVNGSLEKWEIKKIYPIDKKDEKINQLEEEIKKLREMINNEYSKPNEPINGKFESNVNDDGNVKSKSKTNSK